MNGLDITKEHGAKLVSAELFYDDKTTLHKEHYLRLEYECEDERAVYRVTYPHVKLPLFTDRLPSYQEKLIANRIGLDQEITIGAGYGNMLVPIGSTAVVVEEIKKKCHKMTLAEVEEKLGYKIELIS